jgi:hypothetical protein
MMAGDNLDSMLTGNLLPVLSISNQPDQPNQYAPVRNLSNLDSCGLPACPRAVRCGLAARVT